MLFLLEFSILVLSTFLSIPSEVLSQEYLWQSNQICPEVFGPRHRCVSGASCQAIFRNPIACMFMQRCGPGNIGFCSPVIHPHSPPRCGIRRPQTIPGNHVHNSSRSNKQDSSNMQNSFGIKASRGKKAGELQIHQDNAKIHAKSSDHATMYEDVNKFDINRLANVTALEGYNKTQSKSSHKSLDAQIESDEESEEQTPVRKSKPQFTIGGKLESNPWPWMVGIYSYPSMKFICGGSLIDYQHVLSAAHCFYPVNSEGDQYAVVVGELDRIRKRTSVKKIFRVEKLYVHEKFSPDCYCHDMALLRLQKVLGSEYTPICLPEEDTAGTGERATVLGWGDTKYSLAEDSSTTRLQILEDIVLYPGNECRGIISRLSGKSLPKEFPDYYLCAGLPDGSKDACLGDSGGPLMHEDFDGFWSLIGIVSFGYKCGNPGTPGTYARVSYFIPWIMYRIEHRP